jgi:osmotically-inducible protein OsmY
MKPELSEKVRAALAQDPRLQHPDEVAVSGTSGIVTLRGTVGGFKQRRAAVEDANGVDGVDEVIDELEVDLLGEDRREPDELRGMALQTLVWDADVPASSVEVEVDGDCWVTLEGEVSHQHQSDAAYDDVSRLVGVYGVTNKIRVHARLR